MANARHASRCAGTLLLVLAWVSSISMSLAWLIHADSVPGVVQPPPKSFPHDSSLVLSRAVPTLHVFLHPKCPCSRATIAALSAILACGADRVAVEVVFTLPEGVASDWAVTSLREEAQAIPRVRLRDDVGCVEARRFGARTSGDAFLYDTDGRLLFRGGLTMARGHHGANGGSAAVLDLIGGARPGALITWPVFGCPLDDAENG